MTMLKAPYRPKGDAKGYDEWFEKTVVAIRNHIGNKDDDYLMLLVGAPGSGKTTLAFHGLEVYMPPEMLNINQVALSREEFAHSNQAVTNMPKPRALAYDEANVNKRASMSTWNRDLLDLYYSNRGLNIFHIWCNPSLQTIDKAFLDERIKAVLMIVGKKNSHFRYYYWFKPEALDKIMDKYGRLNLKVLKKVRDKYAWYMGWFKDYNGVLKQPYLEKKSRRMTMKVEQFYEKYGEDELIDRGDLIDKLKIHRHAVERKMGDLKEGEDYIKTVTGRYKFTINGVERLKELLGAMHE